MSYLWSHSLERLCDSEGVLFCRHIRRNRRSWSFAGVFFYAIFWWMFVLRSCGRCCVLVYFHRYTLMLWSMSFRIVSFRGLFLEPTLLRNPVYMRGIFHREAIVPGLLCNPVAIWKRVFVCRFLWRQICMPVLGLYMPCDHSRVPPRIGRGRFNLCPFDAVAVNRADEPDLDSFLRCIFLPHEYMNY